MSYKVDYHVHTFYSDGTMKPTDLVRMYNDKEYDMIAITDHDGIGGVNEAMIAGEALQLKVIPGIEFSTSYTLDEKKLELHLLGYHIDIEDEDLNDKLVEIRKERKSRNDKLLKLLNELGVELTEEDLIERPKQKYIGKPHFARAIKRKGYYIENMWEVFDEVDRWKIDSIDAMNLVKGAGGMSVLAHPMKIKNIGEVRSEEFWTNLDKLVKELKKAGLKGIECYHPSANEDDNYKLVSVASKYHLHITEGTDFHSEDDISRL